MLSCRSCRVSMACIGPSESCAHMEKTSCMPPCGIFTVLEQLQCHVFLCNASPSACLCHDPRRGAHRVQGRSLLPVCIACSLTASCADSGGAPCRAVGMDRQETWHEWSDPRRQGRQNQWHQSGWSEAVDWNAEHQCTVEGQSRQRDRSGWSEAVDLNTGHQGSAEGQRCRWEQFGWIERDDSNRRHEW